MKNINWNSIYSFYEVARYSSMTEAASVMDISLPTISEQISRLEKEINMKLFDRSIRKLNLTKEGLSLFLIVKEMFKYGPLILKNISPDCIGGQSITVGLPEGIAAEFGPRVILQYWDKYISYGTVDVEKVSHHYDLIRGILKGKYEWGITCEVFEDEKVAIKKIGTEEIQFCCSEKIYNAFNDKKDILKYIPFIRNKKDTALNEKVSNHFSLIHSEPDEYIDIDQSELTLNLIQKDRCVSVLTKQKISKLSGSSGIRGFTLLRPIFIDFYAIWPKDREKSIGIRKMVELFETTEVTPVRDVHDSYLQLKIVNIPKEVLIDSICN